MPTVARGILIHSSCRTDPWGLIYKNVAYKLYTCDPMIFFVNVCKIFFIKPSQWKTNSNTVVFFIILGGPLGYCLSARSACSRGFIVLFLWSHSNRPMHCLITCRCCFEPLLSHMAQNQCLKTTFGTGSSQPWILTMWSSWQTQWTKNNLWSIVPCPGMFLTDVCQSNHINVFLQNNYSGTAHPGTLHLKIRKLSGNIFSCW